MQVSHSVEQTRQYAEREAEARGLIHQWMTAIRQGGNLPLVASVSCLYFDGTRMGVLLTSEPYIEQYSQHAKQVHAAARLVPEGWISNVGDLRPTIGEVHTDAGHETRVTLLLTLERGSKVAEKPARR